MDHNNLFYLYTDLTFMQSNETFIDSFTVNDICRHTFAVNRFEAGELRR